MVGREAARHPDSPGRKGKNLLDIQACDLFLVVFFFFLLALSNCVVIRLSLSLAILSSRRSLAHSRPTAIHLSHYRCHGCCSRRLQPRQTVGRHRGRHHRQER